MDFVHLTDKNAKKYIGNQIIFKLKEKPELYTLCNIVGEHFVISSEGKQHLLSVKHPAFVIVYNKESTNSLHYSMNFLKASPNNIAPYVGNYVVVEIPGKKVSINKIRSVSKSLYYISVKSGIAENSVDLRGTSCYVII